MPRPPFGASPPGGVPGGFLGGGGADLVTTSDASFWPRRWPPDLDDMKANACESRRNQKLTFFDIVELDRKRFLI
jgi:hypothetical protein